MKELTLIVFFCFFTFLSVSQIVPPGIGKTNTASSFIFGIDQAISSSSDLGWKSTTYIGIARKSHVNSYNPFKNQGAFFINQEFFNRFHKNWEHSLALNYTRQDLYLSDFPYTHDQPSYKNEIKAYGRLSYLFKTTFFELTPTFRQEFSKYYAPKFKTFSDNMRIRSRFRLKFTFNLEETKKHRISLYSEQLISSTLNSFTRSWSKFEYKESRFSIYYSLSPSAIPFTFNFGYVNNLLGTKKPFSVHYFAIDVIWKNPLKFKK